MGWRLIDTDIADPYYVTAADDAIAQARKQDKVPNTLHFYRRHLPCISVGRSRKIEEDIDLKLCRKHNVKIVRRTTGGGTIYTDKGCLIYGLIFRNKGDTSLETTFKNICSSVVSALERFNIHTTYKKPNDILLHGKKISGSAQVKKDNITLIHGTLLVDTNLELMNNVLKNSKNTQVSTLARESTNTPPIKDLKEALKIEFEKHFNSKIKKGNFTSHEQYSIEKLINERYTNDKWTFMR